MCASSSRSSVRKTRGFGTPESLVGVGLAFVAILGALAAARGVARLGAAAAARSSHALGAHWALERLAREAGRAGHRVCPGARPACTDEALEFLAPGAVAFRGDLDGDDPSRALWPERWLAENAPVGPATSGNDEVVAYLARGPRNSGERVRFDADLDGSDRVTLDDGTLLARRDGTVDPVDAGPYLETGETRDGILYRVTFVHDARHAGTGRFRVVEPLLDGVARFRVRGLDAQGMDVGTCGGADASFARDCRAAVRRLAVELAIDDPEGGRLVARRDIDLPLALEARR